MSVSDMIQLAIAVPALSAFLWGTLNVMFKVRDIWKEMKPNGGASLKDQMGAVQIVLNQHTQRFGEQDIVLGGLGRSIKNMQEDAVEVKEVLRVRTLALNGLQDKLEKFGERFDDAEARFARYVIHEAKQDLNASNLLKEEESLLKKIQEEQRKKVEK
jgi:hypothetical protein